MPAAYSVAAGIAYGYKRGYVVATKEELDSHKLNSPIWCASYDKAYDVARALNRLPPLMEYDGPFLRTFVGDKVQFKGDGIWAEMRITPDDKGMLNVVGSDALLIEVRRDIKP